MLATQAVVAVGKSANEDGSILNQLLKFAVIALVIILVIAAAFWVFIIVSNWDNIKAFLQVLYTFFGGGILGLLNPFSDKKKVLQNLGVDIGTPSDSTTTQFRKMTSRKSWLGKVYQFFDGENKTW